MSLQHNENCATSRRRGSPASDPCRAERRQFRPWQTRLPPRSGTHSVDAAFCRFGQRGYPDAQGWPLKACRRQSARTIWPRRRASIAGRSFRAASSLQARMGYPAIANRRSPPSRVAAVIFNGILLVAVPGYPPFVGQVKSRLCSCYEASARRVSRSSDLVDQSPTLAAAVQEPTSLVVATPLGALPQPSAAPDGNRISSRRHSSPSRLGQAHGDRDIAPGLPAASSVPATRAPEPRIFRPRFGFRQSVQALVHSDPAYLHPNPRSVELGIGIWAPRRRDGRDDGSRAFITDQVLATPRISGRYSSLTHPSARRPDLRGPSEAEGDVRYSASGFRYSLASGV